MLIFNDNKGRLGNSLFRLFANIVFLTIYNPDAQIYNYMNKNSLCFDDNNFEILMNCVLNGTIPKLTNLNANYLFDGYYQHDAIFVKFKKVIIDYIGSHPNLIIKTDKNDSHQIIKFINYPNQKQYNIVVHLRLEDFITIAQVIDPNCIQVVIDEIASLYSNEPICIVVNKLTTDIESKYVNFLKKRNPRIIIESNDVITDFTIMKNAKVLVCSCSTLSWSAALLSTTLQKVYVPDYIQVNGSHQTFKKPIENTTLYNIRTCTFDELSRILNLDDQPKITSYSLTDSKGQHLDVKLDKLLGSKTKGIYIELGAFDGLTQSNTAFFEFYRDWTGILIEPSKNSYELCCKNRPKSIHLNLCCVSSDYEEKTILGDFNSITMASVNGERLKSSELVRVNCSTLSSIIQEHIPNKPIDFLSLDTEGYELNILKGLDLHINRPKFMLIEVYKTDFTQVCDYLLLHNYAIYSNFSNYNHIDSQIWDGTHNDYLFYDEKRFPKIVSGERIQELCDIYLGLDLDFYFNPVIANQPTKHCNLNRLKDEFDNPSKIFCHTHRIDILSSVVHLFKNDFILVTHNSDHEIRETNDDVIRILNCNKLLKWFGHNVCFQHEKLAFLPIGLANSQWPYGDLTCFHNIRFSSLNKTNNVYFNFNIATNTVKRQICYDVLKNKLQWLETIDAVQNQKRLASFRFCICPEGNGVDTHRLWECLYLNVVPIVVKNEFTNLLLNHGVPLVILDSWEDFDLNSLNYADFNFESTSLQELLDFSNYSSKIRV
jgi:FkbM family methyltransferase